MSAGETGSIGHAPASTWLFDPRAGSWHRAAAPAIARAYEANIALPDGRLVAIGGKVFTMPGKGTATRSVEIFDPR